MSELCEDCHGSGEMLVQNIKLGRPFMQEGKITYPYTTRGEWIKTPCHCLPDEEDKS